MLFYSSCAKYGRPKLTVVVKSPHVTESSARWCYSGKSSLHAHMGPLSTKKRRFLQIFKTLSYHGMWPSKMTGLTLRLPMVTGRFSMTSVHHIKAYQSG